MSEKQLKELIKALLKGVDVVADDKADKDFDQDAAIQEIKDGFKDDIIAENEKDIIDKAIKAETGKQNGSLLAVVQRHAGIPKKDLEGKSFDEIIKAVKEKLVGEKDKEDGEWKKKYDDLLESSTKDLEEKENTWKAKYDADIAAEKSRFDERDKNDAFLKFVQTLTLKGDLLEHAETLRLKAEKKGYQITVVDGELEMKDKAGKKVKAPDVLGDIAKNSLPIVTSMKGVNPKDIKNKGEKGQTVIDAPEDKPNTFAGEKMSVIEQWANQETE